MWDFEARHVAGKKNSVANALSRYPMPDDLVPPKEPEDDVEGFVGNMIEHISQCFNMTATPAPSPSRVLSSEYSDESEAIAVFLTTGKVPKSVPRQGPRAWKKKALTPHVTNSLLFKKASRNVAVRRVVDDPNIQVAAIEEIHMELRHQGINSVYSVLAQRY
jgi:hypothetical protein